MFLRVPEGPALSPSFKAFTFVASELGAIVQWISKVKQGLDATTTAVSSGFTSFYNSLNPSQRGAVEKAVEREAVASQPRNWTDLTDAQKTAAQKILDFGDLSDLPEDGKNKEILEHVLKNIVPTLDFSAASTEAKSKFIGDIRGTGEQQCKPWIQDWLEAQGFTDEFIPANKPSDADGIGSYEWYPHSEDTAKVTVVESIRDDQTFEEMIDPENADRPVHAGDIVQMGYGNIPHTMVITKIEETGIWVLDTNFGQEIPVLVDLKEADGLFVNGVYREATPTEIKAGLATHTLKPDNTVRIHFMVFEVKDNNGKLIGGLNAKVSMATVYRIPQ